MQQYMGIFWIVGLGALMYFMMIRPQQKQKKERASMMDNLKKGDRVITVGGIYGIVRGVKEERVTLEIASEIYVQFTKNAIGTVTKTDTKAPKAQEQESLPAAEDLSALDAADIEDADYEFEADEDTNEGDE